MRLTGAIEFLHIDEVGRSWKMSVKFHQRCSGILGAFQLNMSLKLQQRCSGIFIIIIIIFKSGRTGPSVKNKVVYKLLSQPHKHQCHGKLKKAQLREATNGWQHPWNHPTFWYQIRWNNSTLKLKMSIKLHKQRLRNINYFGAFLLKMWIKLHQRCRGIFDALLLKMSIKLYYRCWGTFRAFQ